MMRVNEAGVNACRFVGRCAFGIYNTRTLRENQFGTTVLVTGYPGAGAS